MKKTLIYMFAFFLCGSLFAENFRMGREAYNWYFGNQAGITFNTPDKSPEPFNGCQIITLEGCASISDSEGKTIFYTDGFYVKNKFNKNMPDGSYLNGHYSATQSSLIAKKPGQENIYYVFTVDYQIGKKGFCYSVVDMNGDNSLGAVIEKNIPIKAEVTEKLTAAWHANGKDIWIIVHGWNNNKFLSYLLTEEGLSQTPVESSVGMVHTGGLLTFMMHENKVGYMRVSPDGRKIACAIRMANTVQIVDFDNKTGRISNPIELTDKKFEHPYGIEFSSDRRFLYLSKLTDSERLYQIDLQYSNAQDIINNSVLIDTGSYDEEFLGGIQSGPDGKIYIAQFKTKYLAVISDPCQKGIDCGFQTDAIYLENGECIQGLPNFSQLSYKIERSEKADVSLCEGETLLLFAGIGDKEEIDSYLWKGPNGFSSNDKDLFISNIKSFQAGIYTLEAEGKDVRLIRIFNVKVHEKPEAEIIGDEVLIPGDKIELEISKYEQENRYLWSTGETSEKIIIEKPGDYWVRVESPFGCCDTAYHSVQFVDSLYVEIAGPDLLCEGDRIQLKALPEGPDYSYSWSTGDTSNAISISVAGNYSVTVTDESGRYGTDSKNIENVDKPVAEIILQDDKELCEGEILVMKAYKQDGCNYIWSTGEWGDSIIVEKSGTYILIAQNEHGCINADTSSVTFNPMPALSIIPEKDPVICSDESIELHIEQGYEDCKWSTGETGSSIIVNKPGIYSATYTNEHGCSAFDSIEIVPVEYNLAFSDQKRDSYDFENVSVGNTQTKQILLTNNGNHKILIDSIEPVQEGDAFSISHAVLPVELSSNSSIEIVLNFSPCHKGIHKADIKVDISEPCEHQIISPVSGLSTINTIVWLPDTTGIIGDNNFRIPLKAKLETPDDYSLLMSYRAEIRYIADMYMPREFYICDLNDIFIEDDQRVLIIEGDDIIISNQETTIGEFEGTVLLGDKNETPLIISDFAYRSEFVNFSTINGRLRIAGLCFQNGSRITLLDVLQAKVSPNPSSGGFVQIDLENCSEGDYEIKIYDARGILVKKLTWKNGKEKTKSLRIDLTGIPSGIYQVAIIGPFRRIIHPVTILN